jgi:hypothetical protein
LVDAFHVPKLLSQQLLPFGRSGDGLGVLTFGVEQFSVLFVPGGRSARACGQSASTVFFACSSCSYSASLSIRFGFEFWLEVVSDSLQQWADSPRVPGGQSTCSPRTVHFSGFATGGSVGFNGQSAAQAGQSVVPSRTVRGKQPDGPRGTCGQSAPPGRTVRQCVAALFLGSIPSSFFRPSACASRNHS